MLEGRKVVYIDAPPNDALGRQNAEHNQPGRFMRFDNFQIPKLTYGDAVTFTTETLQGQLGIKHPEVEARRHTDYMIIVAGVHC